MRRLPKGLWSICALALAKPDGNDPASAVAEAVEEERLAFKDDDRRDFIFLLVLLRPKSDFPLEGGVCALSDFSFPPNLNRALVLLFKLARKPVGLATDEAEQPPIFREDAPNCV